MTFLMTHVQIIVLNLHTMMTLQCNVNLVCQMTMGTLAEHAQLVQIVKMMMIIQIVMQVVSGQLKKTNVYLLVKQVLMVIQKQIHVKVV